MVSGTVLLIGKIVFLLALYGFLFTVLRALLASTREPAERRDAERGRHGDPTHLSSAPVLHPPARRPATEPATSAPASPAPAERELQPPAMLRAAREQPVREEFTPSSDATVTAGFNDASGDAPADSATPDDDRIAPPADEPLPAITVDARPELEPEPEREPHLKVLTSPEASLAGGAEVSLGIALAIGRSDDNDLVLNDRFVSSRHAEIFRQGGRLVLRDLGSTNGTFCNGVRVEGEVALTDGDRIGIGTNVFAFRDVP